MHDRQAAGAQLSERPPAVWTRSADAPEGSLSHQLEGQRHDLFIELAQAGKEMSLAEASACKLYCAQAAMEVALEAVQLFGGNGYISGEYMIERIWRDMRIGRVYDGSSEVQQMLLAHQLRKGNVQTAW